MELTLTHQEILQLCADDDTGFWDVIQTICGREHSHSIVPKELRQKVLGIVRDLLEMKLIEVGMVNGPGFKPLSSSVEDIVNYIESVWSSFNKPVGLGDICWLRATTEGEKIAHDLNAQV